MKKMKGRMAYYVYHVVLLYVRDAKKSVEPDVYLNWGSGRPKTE